MQFHYWRHFQLVQCTILGAHEPTRHLSSFVSTMFQHRCVGRNYLRSFDQAISYTRAFGQWYSYLVFLQVVLPMLLQNFPANTEAGTWFHHDGTPAHICTDVRNSSDTTHRRQWIGWGSCNKMAVILTWIFLSRLLPLGPYEVSHKISLIRWGARCKDCRCCRRYQKRPRVFSNPGCSKISPLALWGSSLLVGTHSRSFCDSACTSYLYHFLLIKLHSYCTLRVYIKLSLFILRG